MGQTASKVASQLSSRVTSSSTPSAATKIQGARPGAAAAKAAATPRTRTEIEKRSYTDPHAVHGGFTRGGEGSTINHRDERQRQFINEHRGDPDLRNQEMPADLIKFLNDVGPLKKQPSADGGSKSRKKTRPPRQLAGDRAEETEGEASAAREMTKKSGRSDRLQESMPLTRNVEGFETVRTTNFSRKVEEEDVKDFGLGAYGIDYFDLLQLKRTIPQQQTMHEAVESFYKQHTEGRDGIWSEEEKETHKSLLRSTLECFDLPVIMKDTDDSYVGSFPNRIDDLKQLKLVEMPNTKVKLVLEDISEMTRKKKT